MVSTTCGGFTADLNTGSGGRFNLGAQLRKDGHELRASGSITDLPTQMHLETDGGLVTYEGDGNPRVVTPDLNRHGFSLPDSALHVLAIFTSPYGKDFDAGKECEFKNPF